MNKEQKKILTEAFIFILATANEEQAQEIIDVLGDLAEKKSNIGAKKMTGKEALLDLIDTIKYTHNDGKTLLPYDKTRTDAIMKDLEVLEFIKYNFLVYKDLFPNGKWQLILKQKNSIVEESKGYELLKEWLER